MRKTVYEIKNEKIKKGTVFALVSDLHGADPALIIKMLEKENPDYILLPGDILEELNGVCDEKYNNGMKLLTESAKIAPTFYSMGNHEDGATRSWSMKWKKTVKSREYNEKCVEDINRSGAHFLADGYTVYDGIAFGGLLTGLIFEGRKPRTGWLEGFYKLPEAKILLCHHPEYYEEYLKDKDIDLIVSGHAHGGQWRIFGRGLFAPGQGLFPKYTKGLYDNKFVISTGLKKGSIPRFFNPTEIVFIKTV